MATKKGSSKKAASKGGSKKQARGSGKRELIENAVGDFYAKRGKDGQFSEMDERGHSLAADRRKSAKTKVKPGYGDQGDQPQKERGGLDGKAKSVGKRPDQRGDNPKTGRGGGTDNAQSTTFTGKKSK